MRDLTQLKEICQLLRYDIVTATTAAGSGHPTSSLSAVELMATLFFGGFLKYDIKNHTDISNDRIIFSKGHAAPLLYSLYHVAGAVTKDELLSLRQLNSNLEGHPTPRFPYVDVATGSLGQGLSIGLGMAMGIKMKHETVNIKHIALPKVWVLLGDSEMAEGQNWEAMEVASYYKVNNLVGIIDVSRLGQRGETMIGWNLEKYAQRVSSFGWNVIIIEDGHDLKQVYDAFKLVETSKLVKTSSNQFQPISTHKPTMIIAKTIKGKGISFLENKDGWHGKPIPKDLIDEALREIGQVDLKLRAEIANPQRDKTSNSELKLVKTRKKLEKYFKFDSKKDTSSNQFQPILTTYKHGDLIATRQAYGTALVALGEKYNDTVVLDAEMANSLFEEEFAKKFPSRYFEMFIAEQNMISVALGLNKVGFTPFAASFGSFLSRSFDQIRMAQYSLGNIKIVGSHVGVSIGNDGSSQMALEDISMVRSILNSIVLYPSDASSTVKLVEQMMQNETICYLRLTREKTPVIYDNREEFPIGGSKILCQSESDTAVIFAAGITLHEALKAYEILQKENIKVAVVDLYSVKPIDIKTVQTLASQTGQVIVVEDHYPAGGIGEAVLSAMHSNSKFEIRNSKTPNSLQISNLKFQINFTHLCVRKLPHSGTPSELLHYGEIDAAAIVKAVLKN